MLLMLLLLRTLSHSHVVVLLHLDSLPHILFLYLHSSDPCPQVLFFKPNDAKKLNRLRLLASSLMVGFTLSGLVAVLIGDKASMVSAIVLIVVLVRFQITFRSLESPLRPARVVRAAASRAIPIAVCCTTRPEEPLRPQVAWIAGAVVSTFVMPVDDGEEEPVELEEVKTIKKSRLNLTGEE